MAVSLASSTWPRLAKAGLGAAMLLVLWPAPAFTQHRQFLHGPSAKMEDRLSDGYRNRSEPVPGHGPAAAAGLAEAMDRLLPGLSIRSRWNDERRGEGILTVSTDVPAAMLERFGGFFVSTAGARAGVTASETVEANDLEVDCGRGRSFQARKIRMASGMTVFDDVVLLDGSGSFEARRMIFFHDDASGSGRRVHALDIERPVLTAAGHPSLAPDAAKTGFSSSLRADRALLAIETYGESQIGEGRPPQGQGASTGGRPPERQGSSKGGRLLMSLSGLSGEARFAGSARVAAGSLSVEIRTGKPVQADLVGQADKGADLLAPFLDVRNDSANQEGDGETSARKDAALGLMRNILLGAMAFNGNGEDGSVSLTARDISLEARRDGDSPPALIEAGLIEAGLETSPSAGMLRLHGKVDSSFSANVADGLPGGDLLAAHAGGPQGRLAALGQVDMAVTGDRLVIAPADMGVAGLGRLRLAADADVPGLRRRTAAVMDRLFPGVALKAGEDGATLNGETPEEGSEPSGWSSLMAATIGDVSLDIRDDGAIAIFRTITGMTPLEMLEAARPGEMLEAARPGEALEAVGAGDRDGKETEGDEAGRESAMAPGGLRGLIASAAIDQLSLALRHIERTGSLSIELDQEGGRAPAAMAALSLAAKLKEITAGDLPRGRP